MGRENLPLAAKKKMICKEKQKREPKRQISPSEQRPEPKEAWRHVGASNDDEVSKQASGSQLFGVLLTQSEDLNAGEMNETLARKEQRKSGNFVKEPPMVNVTEQCQSAPHAISQPIVPLVQHTITRIVKPVAYRTSVVNYVCEREVLFMVMRSDGTQMMINDKYLKAHYPLVLIDYYEECALAKIGCKE